MTPVGNPATRLTYVPALDGMRGISLPGTIFTHFAIFLHALPTAPGWLRLAGPFTLNIEMFFTLSGALITSLLVSEFQRTGTVSLKRFYLRRSRRLGPALVFTVPVLLLVQSLVPGHLGGPPMGPSPWVTAGAVLLFLGNWRLAGGGTALGWLGPAWTLGIEEQFYLTWPTLLVMAMRRRWRQVEILLALTVATLLCVAYSSLAYPRVGWEKTVYMTPTQIPSILVGCALGYVLTTSPDCWLARALGSRLVALAGVGGMALMSLAWYDQPAVMSHGGFVAYGASACLVIGHCLVRANNPSVVNRVLGWKPFVIIGQVSYEAYLIHCIVILGVLRAYPTMDVTRMIALDCVLISAISAAFYYGVAAPIRKLGWLAALRLRPVVVRPAAGARAGL
jgi:peptidoglycan/LPS O-acetylase OafA/YrhL